MYLENLNHKIISGMKFCYVIKGRNHLKINELNYIRNRQKKTLVILAESEQVQDNKEVYVFLNGNILIIEAPMNVPLDRPIRTQLLEREVIEKFELDSSEIGFTEIRLNKNFRYDLVSFRMIKPGLIKIILDYNTINN
ncbi:MAG: hypothetical protein AMS27_06800 [Bacteroides sp. SM23_62_1]|nr:MAG: hypothetical protein AMS27_06800 [Bacteroides sp. SM23_62_1]